MARDFVTEAQTRVVCDIGQIDANAKRALRRAVAAGTLAQWRGYWHPVAGAPFGIGPLKTCYGTAAARDYFTGEAED